MEPENDGIKLMLARKTAEEIEKEETEKERETKRKKQTERGI